MMPAEFIGGHSSHLGIIALAAADTGKLETANALLNKAELLETPHVSQIQALD
jgi:hypothetical protein